MDITNDFSCVAEFKSITFNEFQNIYHEVKETVEIYNIRKQPTYIGKISARGNFIVKSTLISRGKFLSQVTMIAEKIHCHA
jgi:hypothetical protein